MKEVVDQFPRSTTDSPLFVYDDPLVQKQFLLEASVAGGGDATVLLQLDNIRCAGCCNKIEKGLRQITGVLAADLNFTTHQLRLTWDHERIKLSELLSQIEAMGFPAHPLKTEIRAQTQSLQRKQLISQLGVAGAFGMQIMVLSVCLYAGEWWGIEPAYERYFRYVSALLILPVVLYSARPFLSGAVSDLRHGRVGMDVPVSLGLSIAFLASCWALWNGAGATYFDSISMFVFLVLGARLVELNARIRATTALGQYDTVLPDSAVCIQEDGTEVRVPVLVLKPQDTVRVDTGEVVPADGFVLSGKSSLDESLLTGESMPVVRGQGDVVIAGSVNIENPLIMQISHTGSDMVISGIARLVGKAQFEKPRVSPLVEALSGWFVGVVLTIASLVALVGYIAGYDQWLSSTIAVLIVSCPCALALATPAAISMAMGSALSRGLLVKNSAALETLPSVDHVFIDKTGTLTTGEFELDHIATPGVLDPDEALNIAVALEAQSSHPIARSFQSQKVTHSYTVSDFSHEAGGGLSGVINGQTYFIGNAAFTSKHTIQHQLPNDWHADGTVAILADGQGIQAIFALKDHIRPGARDLIKQFYNMGCKVTLLSGDRLAAVKSVARQLSVADFIAECTPAKKLETITKAREHGQLTVMIGDGLNDAPVLGAADVSIAIGDRMNLTTSSADIVSMNPQLHSISWLWTLTARLSRTIRQNLTWALAYNAIAIPFAAVGLVPPWLAAIGMSLSSLVVVLNAARLSSVKDSHAQEKDSSPVGAIQVATR